MKQDAYLLGSVAEQGDAKAQAILGSMYSLGEGVTQDKAEGVKWYKKAAMQGHAGAQAVLGRNYVVEQDYVEATKWFRLAAEQGDVGVQVALGGMYYDAEKLIFKLRLTRIVCILTYP